MENEIKPFDLKVHHIDPKSKRIVKSSPYIRHAHAEHGVMFERNGKFYYENGKEVPAEKNWMSTGASVSPAKQAAK